MNSSILQKFTLAATCAAVFVLAAFCGHTLISYFFDPESPRVADRAENLGELVFQDSGSDRDEASEPGFRKENSKVESREISADEEEPEEIDEVEVVSAPEKEPDENTDAELEVGEIDLEGRLEVEYDSAASPASAEDPFSNERFLARVSDNFRRSDGNRSNSTDPGDDPSGENPDNDPPVIPPDPDVPDPGDPGTGAPPAGEVDVTVGLGGDGPVVGLGLETDESGSGLNLSVGTSGNEGTDDSGSNETEEALLSVAIEANTSGGDVESSAGPQEQQAAPAQQAAVVRTPSRDGRVRVGQNVYSNALGGSVSGLIGGVQVPTSSERVRYRPADGELSVQHSSSGLRVGALNSSPVSGLVPSSGTISANGNLSGTSAVPQISPTTPGVSVNAGGSGGVSLPINLPAGAPVGGVNVTVPTNIIPPSGAGINTGGININVNLGGQ